jgi:uncharacterized small protein (DUF1192 family)
MIHDDEPRDKGEVLTPGEDLEIYGVEQLAARIATLKDELARTETMLAKKKTGLAAADSLFKT